MYNIVMQKVKPLIKKINGLKDAEKQWECSCESVTGYGSTPLISFMRWQVNTKTKNGYYDNLIKSDDPYHRANSDRKFIKKEDLLP